MTVEAGGPQWRSNPSNPLGRLSDPLTSGAPSADMDRRGYDMWDEAFFAPATTTWTDPSLHDSTVSRLGSLTKTWACPGLRLGDAVELARVVGVIVAVGVALVGSNVVRRRPGWSR